MQIAARECHSASDVHRLNQEIVNRRKTLFGPAPQAKRIEPVFVPPVKSRKPGVIHEIQNAVCDVWGVDRDRLLSKCKLKGLVEPRHAAVAISVRISGRSKAHVGKKFGGKDHSTVIHAEKKLKTYVNIVQGKLPADATPAMWAEALYKEIHPRNLYAQKHYRKKATVQ